MSAWLEAPVDDLTPEDREQLWAATIARETPEPRSSMRDRVLRRHQLRDLPSPEPLIARTLDLRTIALLVGNRSTLKTFIALDWACSVATGHPWQGRPTRAGRVLYVAAEGAFGLHQRIEAWETAWDLSTDETLDIYPAPINLTDRDQVTELAAISDGYTLVVLDTLARCAVGADENSARDMGLIVDSIFKVRGNGDRTVLLVHHTGKDRETTRGSSSLEAGVDTVYLAEGDARLLKLGRRKRKDGPLHRVHSRWTNRGAPRARNPAHVHLRVQLQRDRR
jgi:RecA-family ATPase